MGRATGYQCCPEKRKRRADEGKHHGPHVSLAVFASAKSLMIYAVQLVKLADEDMKAVDSIHKRPGLHKALLDYLHKDGKVLGWTYEQLGWNMTEGGFVPQ